MGCPMRLYLWTSLLTFISVFYTLRAWGKARLKNGILDQRRNARCAARSSFRRISVLFLLGNGFQKSCARRCATLSKGSGTITILTIMKWRIIAIGWI